MNNKAFGFLKSGPLYVDSNGKTVYRKAKIRAFLIALLAGNRTIVMNADVSGNVRCRENGGIIAFNTFRAS